MQQKRQPGSRLSKAEPSAWAGVRFKVIFSPFLGQVRASAETQRRAYGILQAGSRKVRCILASIQQSSQAYPELGAVLWVGAMAAAQPLAGSSPYVGFKCRVSLVLAQHMGMASMPPAVTA